MAIKEKDIKILWGRAASRCSICRIQLTENTNSENSFLIGEQAHIVATTQDGPRGESILAKEERDIYENLILLCPNHHTIIDKNVDDYPVEKLHNIKQKHEIWVHENLATSDKEKDQVAEIIYSDLIDSIVEACELDKWDFWSGYAVSSSYISWKEKMISEKSFELYRKICGAVFPNTLLELEDAIKVVGRSYQQTINIFSMHCKLIDDAYIEERFYQNQDHKPERYEQSLKKYELWKDTYFKSMYMLVKSLNWFADIVRRDINPLFFATKGKFLLTEGDLLGYSPNLYEFTKNEKANIWDVLKKFESYLNQINIE